MAKKSAAEKLEDLLGNLTELTEQNRKEGISEAREYLAKELIRDSKQTADILRSLMEDNEFAEAVTDYPNFRMGMRFAAMLIADETYEY